MLFENRNGKRIGLAGGGREYVIGYALGQRLPWVVEHNGKRFATIDEAEAHVHEIDAITREGVAP